MAKRIIDKIQENVKKCKDKNISSIERRNAYLTLLRLNKLKQPGNILKRPNYEMWGKDPKLDTTFEHNYLISEVNNKNNVKVNLITHSKKIKPRYKINSLSTDDKPSFLIKKQKELDYKKRNLKFYDFMETPLNNKVSNNDKNYMVNLVLNYKNR